MERASAALKLCKRGAIGSVLFSIPIWTGEGDDDVMFEFSPAERLDTVNVVVAVAAGAFMRSDGELNVGKVGGPVGTDPLSRRCNDGGFSARGILGASLADRLILLRSTFSGRGMANESGLAPAVAA